MFSFVEIGIVRNILISIPNCIIEMGETKFTYNKLHDFRTDFIGNANLNWESPDLPSMKRNGLKCKYEREKWVSL